MSDSIFTVGSLVRNRSGRRALRVLSSPRRIAGGYVVDVTWEHADGEPHPAQAPGFTWCEPTLNLVSY